MKREIILKHEFVEFIPDKLEDGIVYVSIPYATVAHECCCLLYTSPLSTFVIFAFEMLDLSL